MYGLTTSWKIFRVISIIQLVMVSLQAMLALVDLFFYNSTIWYSLAGVVIYSVMFFFIYQGLSLLNDNFPDVPLTDKQKLLFNRLFLINFLLIAWLFAKVVNNWWVIPFVSEVNKSPVLSMMGLLAPLLLSAVTFILHLVFLWGMIRLRRVIYQNTVSTWVEQFDESKPG
jgi:hypothetical protein